MAQLGTGTRPATYDSSRYARALADFQTRYPDYASTHELDDLRAREYSRLDRTGQVYLDYTGGGLHADSQVRRHMKMLTAHVYGNPHSNNPTSLASTEQVESARAYVHQFFNAPQDDYVVIFTANTSGALKLVGESYPFAEGGNFLLTFDNHNSVNGIREFARSAGATVTYLPVNASDMRLDQARLNEHLDLAQPGRINLFAYPAQSNFTGVQHSLEWIEKARAKGWDVLLDTAAFAPTNRLDMARWQPDFVPLSFYKIFGYPTGVGALIARRDKLKKLHRPWFAGGTITIVSVQGEGWHYLVEGEAGFEDGTVNYLSLPAIEIGLRHIDCVGMDKIHTRVMTLTGWLLEQMQSLTHSNGKPVMRIFGPLDTERAAALSPSTSMTRTACPLTSVTRSGWPPRTISRYARAASAIQAPARSRTTSSRKRWRSASRATRQYPIWNCTRGCRRSAARPPAQSAYLWASSPTSRTSIASCTSPRNSGTDAADDYGEIRPMSVHASMIRDSS